MGTFTVTTSAVVWLAAIDELGWRRVGPGTSNINWPQVQALIEAVSVNLVNGERVEPDYEAAAREFEQIFGHDHDHEWVKQACDRIVAAAIGDRLLIDPPKEETK